MGAVGFGKRPAQMAAGGSRWQEHGEKFGRKKEEAIAALLSQSGIEAAARVAGVGSRTLLRWLTMPEFQAALRKARRDTYSQSIVRLQQASSAAVSTLLKVMVDPTTPASTKVRAADSVLEHLAKALELEDVEVRARSWSALRRLRSSVGEVPESKTPESAERKMP